MGSSTTSPALSEPFPHLFAGQVNDQYMIKYMASVISLSMYAIFQYNSPEYPTLPLAQRTERYIKTGRPPP